jgi:hypothetical protein
MSKLDAAIAKALLCLRDPEIAWRLIADRYGVDFMLELHQRGSVRIHGEVGDQRAALELVCMAHGYRTWARAGFPLVKISQEDAMSLAHTDPPAWMLASPHGGDQQSAFGVSFGDRFGLIIDWRLGSFMWEDEPVDPFGDRESAKHFVANVGFALLKRPEGLDIREHRPSPKAMRKQGRKHYPTVQYIIQAARDLHPPEPVTERGARDEGWTMSVRTMVRGHWRQQAHGPNHSLRKVMWIRPTWRGPEDAPISIHAARLRADEPR